MTDRPFFYRLVFILFVLVVVTLIIPPLIAAQQEIPPIPHNLDRREDCLDCHEAGRLGAPMIPEDHEGRPNEVCLDCHYQEDEEPKSGPPSIPHTLEFRNNCTDCHTSAETMAPPTPTPVPLPTPIVYPKAEGVNTCIDCHSTLEDENHPEIVEQAQRSIHAERNILCADCHGGDPSASTKEEAKAPGTGYIGKPDKAKCVSMIYPPTSTTNIKKVFMGFAWKRVMKT
jgi:hypothetical protein